MTASLLDVNVLVSLFDPQHIHYEAAHTWFREGRELFATCPITAVGCLRVLSSHAYPRNTSPQEAVDMLRELCARPSHEFWPADLSPLDEAVFDLSQIQGHRQLTDVYLLALAVRHGGQLVTFDRSIPWRAVRGAKASHLKLLGGPVR